MRKKPTVSIVIPVFNEEANLEELFNRCIEVCTKIHFPCEIIFVDDGSSDRSPDMIAKAANANPGKITGIILNRNYGQHAAIIAGFANSTGDIVVTLDADLQNPPEEIPRLVEKIDEGFDVVGSVRTPRNDSFFRRISSTLVNLMVRKTTGVMLHDYGCMLRAYSRPIVNAIVNSREHSIFIPILANSFSNKVTEIKVKHDSRSAGNSKYSLWKLINLQFDLLTGMTTFPLRILSIIGGIISMCGLGFGIFLLVMRIIMGTTWAAGGVFTLFAILFIFVGAQFIGMGLLGEYIGRIYHDVRCRPCFVVSKILGKREAEEKSSPLNLKNRGLPSAAASGSNPLRGRTPKIRE